MIGQIWSIWCSNWRLCPQDLNWLSSSSVPMIPQKSERKGASGHDWDCAMQHFSSELLWFKLMYQFMLSSPWSVHRMRTNLFSNFPKTSSAIVTLCIITDINILHSGENSYFYLQIHKVSFLIYVPRLRRVINEAKHTLLKTNTGIGYVK